MIQQSDFSNLAENSKRRYLKDDAYKPFMPGTTSKQLTKAKIMKLLESHRQDLKKLGVTRIGLFGSFAKGQQHTKSDLDFLITLEKESFDRYMEIKFLLEKLFKRKVDLVLEQSLKPQLRYVKEEAVYATGF